MKLNIQLFGSRGASSFSTSQNMSLEYYVSGMGMWINNYLRGLDDSGDLTKDDKQYLKDLDAMTNSNIKDDVLYRTVDASAIFGNISDFDYGTLRDVLVFNDNQRLNVAKANEILSRMKKEYTEKGFMSTTKSLEIAENNQYFFGSTKPIVMEVHTSKKTKGLDVMKRATSKIREVEKRDPQKEVLLARNQKVQVYDIGSKNGNIYVKVRLK